MPSERIRVAAVNDFEIVVQGLAGLLSRHDDRLEVVDAILIGEPLERPVDVALFDTFGRHGVGVSALKELLGMPEVAKVALFTLELTPDAVTEARQAGASGFISKGLSGGEIADAVVRIARGEAVIAGTPTTSSGPARKTASPSSRARSWRCSPRGSPTERSPWRCTSHRRR
jgi:NarL family two-component system response regulator LiaR